MNCRIQLPLGYPHLCGEENRIRRTPIHRVFAVTFYAFISEENWRGFRLKLFKNLGIYRHLHSFSEDIDLSIYFPRGKPKFDVPAIIYRRDKVLSYIF